MGAAEKEGYDVTYLPVDRYGLIDLKELENAIRDDTILISVMYVNNEIGTIMPVKEVGAIAKKHGILFHTDGVQALGNVSLDMASSSIDMMSMSAHKFTAPRGGRSVYSTRRSHGPLHPRRRPGKTKKSGDGKCTRHCRFRRSGKIGGSPSGGACGKIDGSSRTIKRRADADSGVLFQRSSNETSSGKCQYVL